MLAKSAFTRFARRRWFFNTISIISVASHMFGSGGEGVEKCDGVGRRVG